MTSIVLTDFVGLETLSNGAGISAIVQGLATILASPFVGIKPFLYIERRFILLSLQSVCLGVEECWRSAA